MITNSTPKSLSENAIWNIFLRVWTLVIAFFLTPFLIGKLSTYYYGFYVIIMSISGFMSVLNFGMGEAALRFVAFYHGRGDMIGIKRTVGSVFSIYLLIGTLGALIVYVGAVPIIGLFKISSEEINLGKNLLQMTAFTFLFECFGASFSAIPTALQRFDIKTKLSIAQSIFQISGTVILLLIGYGIYALVLWNLIVTILVQIANVIIGKRLIPALTIGPSFSREGIREVFHYSFFSMLTNIFGIMWANADRLLIGAFVSPNAVAFLSVPQQMVFRGNMLITGASAALLPRFSTMDDNSKVQRLFLDSTFLLLASTIIIFVPTTVLLPDFLRLWITPEFSLESSLIGQIIAGSYIVRGAFYPFHMLFGGMNKPYLLTLHSLTNALIGVTINIILIPKIGLLGAGYSFLVTACVGFFTLMLAWRYVLKNTSFKALIRPVLLPVSLAIILLVLCFGIHHIFWKELGWLALIIEGVLYALLSALTVLGLEYLIGKRDSHLHSVNILLGNLLEKMKTGSLSI
jgi:O-antigen/teichoic acid export membrane protein